MTVITTLYISYSWLLYFVTKLYLLISLTCFFPPLTPSPLETNHLFILHIDDSVSLLYLFICFLGPTCKQNNIVFVFLLWLISVSIILSRSIMLLQMARFLSFLFHTVYAYILHLLYLFVYQLTLRFVHILPL